MPESLELRSCSHDLSQSVTLWSLRRLVPAASFIGCADIRFRFLTNHHQQCQSGALFAAYAGQRCDGRTFAQSAVDHGAVGLLVEKPIADVNIPQCVIKDVPSNYAQLLHTMCGRPTERINLIGVTGTNGKTTVSWMIQSILQAAGHQAGIMGTIHHDLGTGPIEPSSLTTPGSDRFYELINKMLSRGTTHAVAELSSHALDQNRVAGTELSAAVLTNITHDHLDYHGDFSSYSQAKQKILKHVKQDGTVVVNADDDGVQQLLGRTSLQASCDRFGVSSDCFAQIVRTEQSESGLILQLRLDGQSLEIHLNLMCLHNAYNAAAAAAVAYKMGCSLAAIQQGLEQLPIVPGRLERIQLGQPFSCLVDYAHTPEAIEQVLRGLRPHTKGRLICLFGAGGERDQSKRPLMAKASCLADLIAVTSDNPRAEPEQEIIDQIIQGYDHRAPDCIEPDRQQAIRWAIHQARPGDCVVILGKGHENFQLMGQERIEFDDRIIARSMIQELINSPVEAAWNLSA